MATKITSDNISQTTLTVLGSAVPKVSTITYPGDDTATDTAGGQTIILTGSGFAVGATVIVNGTSANVVTFISSSSISFTAPAQSAGTYVIYVINTDGGTALVIPGLSYSGTPSWSTAAGSLGTGYETASISSTVTAAGDAPITYSLFSGTLPTDSTLNSSTGLISGTAPVAASSTTYNFTIRATDGQNQDTNRAFSLTISPDVVTWNSPADGYSTPLFSDTAMSTFTMSATSAAGKSITYTANSLPTGLSISGATIIGTPTVVGSSGSLITATAADSARTATRTFNWVVSVAVDTYWPYTTLLINGEGAAATNNANNASFVDSSASAIAITRSGSLYQGTFSPFSASSFSNYFDGSGDYLSIASNAAFQLGTGDFTIECWVYLTASSVNCSFIDMRNGGVSALGIVLYQQSAGNIAFYTGGNPQITSTSTVAINQWHHVAASRSSGSTKLFIDGAQTGSTYADTNSYIINAPTIGTFSDGSGGNMVGYISNLRIVKGTAVYTSAFTPSTTPLTAITNTQLLTCQSSMFKDNSTNGFAVTRNGDTYVTKFSPFNGTTDYTPATHGGSTFFTTTTDMLTMPTNAAFDFGTGDFTFEFWMWLPATGASGEGAFFSGSASGSSDFVWYQSTLRFGRNAIAWDTTSSTFSPTLQQWYHIAFVKTSGTAKIFVNGVSVASAANGNTYGSAGGTVYIGRSADGSRGFAGIMSNIRIVKGTAVYTSNFTPPTSILTAISGTTFLLNGTNGGIIDQTGLNNIRVLGDAKISTAVKKYNSGSMLFDGTGDYLTIASSPLLAFGTGNFTIEMWVYFNSISGGCALYDARDSGNSLGVLIGIDGANNGPYFHVSGGTRIAGTALSNATWYHIAVARASGSTKLFVNGTQAGSTYTDGNNYIAGIPTIGNNSSGGGGTNYLNGYIDDLRITKGVARYTTTFTAPTAAFNTK